jgi:predicted GIY-YIG superfamily endonuclease
VTVYLIHLDQPYKHARHYTGSAIDLDPRLAKHAAGQGARLLAVVRAAGIGWQLARTWPGGRVRERQLKRQGGASRRCPLCGVHPRPCLPSPDPAAGDRWYWSRGELPGAPPEIDMTTWPEPPF